MRLTRSRPFLREYLKLPPEIRKKVDHALVHLAHETNPPGLRTKKMTSQHDIWEARVDIHYRMTFRRERDVIVLRRVGTHDIYRKL
jgi:mRNA-degrading endonuclease RelE of RelBE toxin-antitoxin system